MHFGADSARFCVHPGVGRRSGRTAPADGYAAGVPVLVTGVEDALGAAVAHTLLRGGGEVRVWVDARQGADAARAWRAAGAKAARGEPTDEGRLEAALAQTHTVVHTAGGPLTDPDEGTEHLATVVAAALGAGVRRLVWVAALGGGASQHARALDVRARLVDALPLDVVTLRTGLVWGPGDALTRWLAARGRAVHVEAVHRPVWVADVAAAVAAADAQRESRRAVHVAAQLVGPDRVPAADLAARLADVAALAGLDAPPSGVDDAAVTAWLADGGEGGPDALGTGGTGADAGLRALVTAAQPATGRP